MHGVVVGIGSAVVGIGSGESSARLRNKSEFSKGIFTDRASRGVLQALLKPLSKFSPVCTWDKAHSSETSRPKGGVSSVVRGVRGIRQGALEVDKEL